MTRWYMSMLQLHRFTKRVHILLHCSVSLMTFKHFSKVWIITSLFVTLNMLIWQILQRLGFSSPFDETQLPQAVELPLSFKEKQNNQMSYTVLICVQTQGKACLQFTREGLGGSLSSGRKQHEMRGSIDAQAASFVFLLKVNVYISSVKP